MFPFIDRVALVVKNASKDEDVMGLAPGESMVIPSGRIDRDALIAGRIRGLEYVGIQVKGEMVHEPLVEEEPEPVEEEPEPIEEEPEPVEEEPENTDSLIEEMCREHKKDELIEMAEELDLDSSGNKADIAKRILDATL